MLRVWPGITVVDANLTVHIAALRRALRDGQAGNRYLVTIPGQGYRFVVVASLSRQSPPARTRSLRCRGCRQWNGMSTCGLCSCG